MIFTGTKLKGAYIISLILGLGLAGLAKAAGPGDGSDGAVIGVASDALECLAIGNGSSGQASGVVKLTWQGQAKQARLILNISGTEAAHSIKVNGQPVAQTPVHPDGQPCRDGEYFYLDFSPEILVQGDNLVEITNDALLSDSWTAAHVRLEVFGNVTAVPTYQPHEGQQVGSANVTIAVVTSTITFTNAYDGSSQQAKIQIPDSYNPGTPTPLFIAVHGRDSVMEWGIDKYGNAANTMGWLLASPQLHGSWPIPADCYTNPPGLNCQFDDQILLTKPGAFAYASLESQYDVIGTVKYMLDHYNVKPDQIYLTGQSMGSQGNTVIAAKYPHLFAAIFDNKGPSDMKQWYPENNGYYQNTMRKECHIGGMPKTTAQNPFCYERRSSVNFASNYIHIPISMTHSISDVTVPIHHSRDLRDAINSYSPDQTAVLFEDTVQGPTCPPSYHCYEPDYMAVLNFLEPFRLNNNPTSVNITTDESKSYYWMKIIQNGGDHWSRVQAAYNLANKTVTATISDTQASAVAFNLGSAPITEVIAQPVIGLPATTYLVKGGGNYKLENYTSGYLTTTLTSTGQFSLTISALKLQLSANPPLDQATTSTITAVAQDYLNNPVPDGTTVTFTATVGTFPNGSSVYTQTTSGGQAAVILTSGGQGGEVFANVGNVTASLSNNSRIYLPVVLKN